MASALWGPNRDAAIRIAQKQSFTKQPGALEPSETSRVVDADFFSDDHAAVWFLTRNDNRTLVDQTFLLERVDGEWCPRSSHGAGGASAGMPRPTLAEIAQRNSAIPLRACSIGYSGGGTRGLPGAPSSLHLLLASEIAELRFSDGRAPKPVADHGRVVLLFDSDDLVVTARNRKGEVVGKHRCELISPPKPESLFKRIASRVRRKSSTIY